MLKTAAKIPTAGNMLTLVKYASPAHIPHKAATSQIGADKHFAHENKGGQANQIVQLGGMNITCPEQEDGKRRNSEQGHGLVESQI